ncbi:hypothetical protein O181_123340 [Austropuccinia psidii MF-1]|uniref:Uncharacterized protein n=1 Tax=Austropuccinia psidii MF-1 TaxID=1389203 RepID=A0A9Q3Q443_9BASI|nr:hypothetical protein [Austropuccinia psidii MF-1]
MLYISTEDSHSTLDFATIIKSFIYKPYTNTAPHLRPHHSLCTHTSSACNTYPPAVPSRYTSYAALNPPYASLSSPINILRCSHCPPDMPPTLPPISTLTTPYASTPLPLTILTLLQCPQDMPLTPPSTPLIPNPLSAT